MSRLPESAVCHSAWFVMGVRAEGSTLNVVDATDELDPGLLLMEILNDAMGGGVRDGVVGR